MISEILKKAYKDVNRENGEFGNVDIIDEDYYKHSFKSFFLKNIENYMYYEAGTGLTNGFPWLAIRDKRITERYKKGFFIMYSFISEGKVILSLFTNNLHRKDLDELYDEINVITNNNIENSFHYTKGDGKVKYPLKYFFIKTYEYDELIEDNLIKDLKYLINLYENLVPKYVQMYPKYEKSVLDHEKSLDRGKEDFNDSVEHRYQDSFIGNLMKSQKK